MTGPTGFEPAPRLLEILLRRGIGRRTSQTEVPEERLLLRESEAARVLAVTPRTLKGWRLRGNGPPCSRLGGRAVRYSASDLAAFVEHGVRRSTSDPCSRRIDGPDERPR